MPAVNMGKAWRLWRRVTRVIGADKLPLLCGARDPSNNRPVAIRRGEPGFFLWTESKNPEDWNKDQNISHEQVRAMIAGSVLGWDDKDIKSEARRK